MGKSGEHALYRPMAPPSCLSLVEKTLPPLHPVLLAAPPFLPVSPFPTSSTRRVSCLVCCGTSFGGHRPSDLTHAFRGAEELLWDITNSPGLPG